MQHNDKLSSLFTVSKFPWSIAWLFNQYLNWNAHTGVFSAPASVRKSVYLA